MSTTKPKANAMRQSADATVVMLFLRSTGLRQLLRLWWRARRMDPAAVTQEVRRHRPDLLPTRRR